MCINHGRNYLNKVHVITLPGCHRNQVPVCRPSRPCPLQCEVGRQLSYLSNDNESPILPTTMAFALQLPHRPSSKNILAPFGVMNTLQSSLHKCGRLLFFRGLN